MSDTETTASYCPSCGTGLGSDGGAFCPGCGAPVRQPAGQPAFAHAGAHQHAPGDGDMPAPPPALGAPAAGPPPGAMPPVAAPPAQRPWLPILIGALLVLIVVGGGAAILLAATSGSAGKNVKNASATRAQAVQALASAGVVSVSNAAPGLFAVVNAGTVNATVPAGWHAVAQTSNGATRATFSDPAHPTSSMTVVVQPATTGSVRVRAQAAAQAIKSKGATAQPPKLVAFPGGRHAWAVTYTNAGVTHTLYLFSACDAGTGVTIDVAAAANTFAQQQARTNILAANANPACPT